MNMRKTLTLLPALLLLALLGCSKVESHLVGKWQNEHLPETVQFFDNKTGIFEVKDKPSIPFKWSVEADKRIKLDFVVGGIPKSLSGTVEKDEFILGNGADQARYARIK